MIDKKGKKILLLNPPGKKPYLRDYYCSLISKGNFVWHPLDLTVLSGILSKHFEITVIDALAEKLKPQECYLRIIKMKPQAIIFLSGAVSWSEDRDFLKELKKKDIQLIGSGDLFLFNAENILKNNDFLDAVILDFTSSEIVNFLFGEKKEFHHLVYKKGNKIISNKEDLSNEKPFSFPPPRLDLFPLKKYNCPVVRFYPFATTIISLNCPYHCRFCGYGNLKFKWREVNNIIEELRYIKSLGIKEVRFKDNTFGANRAQVIELCQRMIKENFNFRWSCSSRIDILDKKLLKLMRDSGCHTIQFGVESGSQKILDMYNKQFTIEQVRKTFLNCQKLKIKTVAHFILGLPGENEESILKTIKLSKELDCDFAAFNIASPRIGSDLRKEAREKRWLKSAKLSKTDSSITYPIMETKEISRLQIWQLRNKAIREFYFRPKYLFKKIIQVRNLHQIKRWSIQGLILLKEILNKNRKSS